MSMSKTRSFNIFEGSVIKKVFTFTLPLMLSGMLQMLYNAADTIVVGRFAGDEALSAVGSTTALFGMFTNLFLGISVGADVLASYFYGAGDEKNMRELSDSILPTALMIGIPGSVLSIAFARPVLSLMGTPDENGILDGATLYISVCLCGIVFTLIYNLGAALMRALGDTRRPFLYLALSGLLNVTLNIVFVAGFDLSVLGVALATVISQALSALLVIIRLSRLDSPFRLIFRGAKPKMSKILRLMKIGFPAGLQNSAFSLSNVMLQSAVNTIGQAAIAGNTASDAFEEIIWAAVSSFQYAAITFTSQCLGAKRPERMNRIFAVTMIMASATGLVLGGLGVIFGRELISFMADSEEAISYGLERLRITYSFYFLAALMPVSGGALGGEGHTEIATLTSFTGVCVLRMIWIYTVFPVYHTMTALYLCYPITWAITSLTQSIIYFAIKRRKVAKLTGNAQAADKV